MGRGGENAKCWNLYGRNERSLRERERVLDWTFDTIAKRHLILTRNPEIKITLSSQSPTETCTFCLDFCGTGLITLLRCFRSTLDGF